MGRRTESYHEDRPLRAAYANTARLAALALAIALGAAGWPANTAHAQITLETHDVPTEYQAPMSGMATEARPDNLGGATAPPPPPTPPPPPPPNAGCPGENAQWSMVNQGTQQRHDCEAWLARADVGDSSTAVDNVGNARGQATKQCTSGGWRDVSALCQSGYTRCLTASLTWTLGAHTCGPRSVAEEPVGVAHTLRDDDPPTLGTVTVTCEDRGGGSTGAWAASNASCRTRQCGVDIPWQYTDSEADCYNCGDEQGQTPYQNSDENALCYRDCGTEEFPYGHPLCPDTQEDDCGTPDKPWQYDDEGEDCFACVENTTAQPAPHEVEWQSTDAMVRCYREADCPLPLERTHYSGLLEANGQLSTRVLAGDSYRACEQGGFFQGTNWRVVCYTPDVGSRTKVYLENIATHWAHGCYREQADPFAGRYLDNMQGLYDARSRRKVATFNACIERPLAHDLEFDVSLRVGGGGTFTGTARIPAGQRQATGSALEYTTSRAHASGGYGEWFKLDAVSRAGQTSVGAQLGLYDNCPSSSCAYPANLPGPGQPPLPPCLCGGANGVPWQNENPTGQCYLACGEEYTRQGVMHRPFPWQGDDPTGNCYAECEGGSRSWIDPGTLHRCGPATAIPNAGVGKTQTVIWTPGRGSRVGRIARRCEVSNADTGATRWNVMRRECDECGTASRPWNNTAGDLCNRSCGAPSLPWQDTSFGSPCYRCGSGANQVPYHNGNPNALCYAACNEVMSDGNRPFPWQYRDPDDACFGCGDDPNQTPWQSDRPGSRCYAP